MCFPASKGKQNLSVEYLIASHVYASQTVPLQMKWATCPFDFTLHMLVVTLHFLETLPRNDYRVTTQGH